MIRRGSCVLTGIDKELDDSIRPGTEPWLFAKFGIHWLVLKSMKRVVVFIFAVFVVVIIPTSFVHFTELLFRNDNGFVVCCSQPPSRAARDFQCVVDQYHVSRFSNGGRLGAVWKWSVIIIDGFERHVVGNSRLVLRV